MRVFYFYPTELFVYAWSFSVPRHAMISLSTEEKRREETKYMFIAPKMRPNLGCITGDLGVGVF